MAAVGSGASNLRHRRLGLGVATGAVALAFVPGVAHPIAAGAAKGPSGITIKRNDGSPGVLLGKIRKGECRLSHGAFHFRAGNQKLSLEVELDKWKGFHHRYLLTVGSPGRVFVVIRGNNGSYSSDYAIAGSKAGTVTVVTFRRSGKVISVGTPDLPNFNFSGFLYVRGAASCSIPRRVKAGRTAR
jgi:hypothetical protein